MTILKRPITRPAAPAPASQRSATPPAPVTPSVIKQAAAPTPVPPDALLTPAEVAARLRVTTKALEHWRRRGDGPAFVRLSRSKVVYSREAIEAYLEERTLRSTAQG